MLIFKRDIYNNYPEMLEFIPWEFICPGCGKTVFIMTEIPFRSCWNCSTPVSTGSNIITAKVPAAARINYYNVGWPLNDRQMEKVT